MNKRTTRRRTSDAKVSTLEDQNVYTLGESKPSNSREMFHTPTNNHNGASTQEAIQSHKFNDIIGQLLRRRWHRVLLTDTVSSFFHKPNARLHQHCFIEKRPLGYGTLGDSSYRIDKRVPYVLEMQEDTAYIDKTEKIAEMEFEVSVQRQRSLLKTLKTCATSLCVIAAMAVLFAQFVTNSSEELIVSDSPVSYMQSPNKLTRVHKPTDLKEIPQHENMIRKLREEFNEWALHHGRDYGDDDERERRFHIWKENHFR
jgi:hypothetical protein